MYTQTTVFHYKFVKSLGLLVCQIFHAIGMAQTHQRPHSNPDPTHARKSANHSPILSSPTQKYEDRHSPT